MSLRDRLKESGRKAREKNLQIQKEMEEEKNNKYNVEYGVKCKVIFRIQCMINRHRIPGNIFPGPVIFLTPTVFGDRYYDLIC